MRLIVFMLCLFVFGCTETRSEKQTEITKNNDILISGSVALPLGDGGALIPLPFNFDLKHVGTEAQNEQGKQETKAQIDALGQQLGGVVLAGIKTAFPALGMLGGKVPESRAVGFTPTETGAGSAAAALALWAAREMLAKRAEQKRYAEDMERERLRLEGVKAQRDRAQAEALEMAKQLPPKTS